MCPWSLLYICLCYELVHSIEMERKRVRKPEPSHDEESNATQSKAALHDCNVSLQRFRIADPRLEPSKYVCRVVLERLVTSDHARERRIKECRIALNRIAAVDHPAPLPADITECRVVLHRLPPQLLYLHDHLLMKILSLLPVESLVAVALTCHRLQSIARSFFELSFGLFRLPVAPVSATHGVNAISYLMHVFQLFGDLPHTIEIRFNEDRHLTGIILMLIEQHCAHTLQTLRIHHMILNAKRPLCSASTTTFDQLKSFTAYKSIFNGHHLFGPQPNLKQLVIDAASLGQLSHITFPRLTTFGVLERSNRCTNRYMIRFYLKEFFERHTKLKKVFIRDNCQLSADEMSYANWKLEQSYKMYGFHEPLSRLANLHVLGISVMNNGMYLTTFLRDCVSAHTLTTLVIDVILPNVDGMFLAQLSRFKQLQRLRLDWPAVCKRRNLEQLHTLTELESVDWRMTDFCNVVDLIEWIEHLDKLQELTITDERGIVDQQAYGALYRMYRGREMKLLVQLLMAPRVVVTNTRIDLVEVVYV